MSGASGNINVKACTHEFLRRIGYQGNPAFAGERFNGDGNLHR
jgi:hypothetical protein